MAGLDLGLIVGLGLGGGDPASVFARVAEIGVPTCQISATLEGLQSAGDPSRIRDAADAAGVRVSAFFQVFRGQECDLARGPATCGLVPEQFRRARLADSIAFADLAAAAGVSDYVTHIGFIPDDPASPLYRRLLTALGELLERLERNGQRLLFETGQETAAALARTLRDLGAPHAGVNLDPANLILYGMSSPLDAVELLGDRVWGMHAKDGLPPNRGEALGLETPLGEGRVPFSLVIPRLRELGFRGPVTIECETSGPRQREDIVRAMRLLAPLCYDLAVRRCSRAGGWAGSAGAVCRANGSE